MACVLTCSAGTGPSADVTLKNLIYYLDPNPDPVRFYGMEGMPRA